MTQLRTRDGKRSGAPTLSPEQINAARKLLGWTMAEMARRANVSGAAASRASRSGPTGTEQAAARIKAAVEAAGVVFDASGGSAGVRLRKDSDGPTNSSGR